MLERTAKSNTRARLPKVGSRSRPGVFYDRRMNFFAPRQRSGDGRWDYTSENSAGIFSIGYCAGWTEHTPEQIRDTLGSHLIEMVLKEQEQSKKFLTKYHRDGHKTASEAIRCYRNYVLDTQLRLDIKLFETQKKCGVCSTWTDGVAEVDHFTRFFLCDAHRVREIVAELYLDGRVTR